MSKEYELDMLDRIYNNYDEEVAKELIWGDFTVEQNSIDARIWAETIETIVKITNKYFRLYWKKGLTELQENEFDSNIEEVYPEHTTKTIEFIKWRKV